MKFFNNIYYGGKPEKRDNDSDETCSYISFISIKIVSEIASIMENENILEEVKELFGGGNFMIGI